MIEPDDVRAVFEAIYETGEWERGSGQGSRADVTDGYRAVLQQALRSGDVRHVVDAGCGDWEFSQLVDWHDVDYQGFDIVPDVIASNSRRFGQAGIRFECVNFLSGQLPAADLLICKDVLQHWPIASIQQFLARSLRRYRYLLLTNDVESVHCPPECHNTDTPMGAWRTVDLERPPFSLRGEWRVDLDIRNEWTKRVVLMVNPRYKPIARVRPRSALRQLGSLPVNRR